MAMYNAERLRAAPTQDSELYPDTDGKPMAVSDDHRHTTDWQLRTLFLTCFFFCRIV